MTRYRPCISSASSAGIRVGTKVTTSVPSSFSVASLTICTAV